MLTQMFKDRKRNKRVLAVICALSILVATGVFNQLMQPVITMTPDPVCGIAEHIHGDDCYGKLLSCGLEEGEEHTHTDGCYEKVLGCGIAEHSHDDSCYPEEVVEQPVVTAEPTAEPTEVPAEPTEAPAEPTEVPAVPAVASELDDTVDAVPAGEPTVEPVISEEPTEAPEDSEMPDFDSVPVVPENEDKSAEETADNQPSDNETTGEPIADAEPTAEPVVEPVAPVISAATVSNEKVLVGQTVTWTFEAVDAAEIKYYITDAEGNEAAYGKLDPAATSISWLADRAGDFVVTIIASNEAGTVSSAGNVSVEAPEKLTAAVRSESASAFAGESITFNFVVSGGVDSTSAVIMIDQDGEIIAETSELTESITVEPKHMGDTVTSLTATITAVDSVGETAQAMVQIPVAVRVRETEEDWAKATRTELSGDWREDLIAVAETQLGYKESKLDFIIDDEGVAHGYTRYGQWWGNTHDEWCATFISFCMEYAEIDEDDFPYNDNCNSWIRDLKKLDLYAEAKDYLPEAGDLVFFDQDDDGNSDHVGIVTKVDDDEIETIEGNSYGEVAELEYKLNDKIILGYASMLKAYEAYLADELDLDLETGVGADAEVVADTVLNAEPDADSAEVASIEAGSIVSVASAQQNLDSVWYEVSTADTTGYLPASTLSLNYVAEDEDAEVNAASTATDSDVAAATRYKNSSGKYGVEVSVRFVPVDANGNERSDVNAPSTVRYYFDYADWKSGKSVKDNCSAITDVITSAEVSDIDLISMNTGARAYHADYAKINVSGYLLAGETSSSATQAITGTSYYYYLEVYYIPAEMTVTFQNDAGETVGTASGVRGATVAVPAIEGYAFNTQNEAGQYLTGWKTSDGTVYGTAIENIQSNLTLTPVWSEATLVSHTITFNYNGSTAQVSAFDGQKFGEVITPDASKDDYRFDGWFTAEDDSGVEYAASTVITGSVALYAHYTEYIDVSFVINNSSYTNDSGYTHVTVDAEYKDAFNTNGLSYALVGTGDRYRVSGTGTLLTFTIPAGESLSDNGLNTDLVNVENQTGSLTSYVSPYAWIDSSSKVCGSDTVFTEDTELYLRLYANNELYSLNFVCCENCTRSITAVLSDNGVSISSPGFAVGEKVDGSFFPQASDVNAYFTCDSCTACGRNSNNPKVLDSWYINGSEFAGGSTITPSLAQSAVGNSITVYATWNDAPSNISVTFRNPNGAEIKSDSEVTMYAPLSEIKPADPALDGCTFVGWTVDGTNVVADNYVITSDVTFTAVYDAAITVQIPDLANGNLETYTTINTMTVRTGSSLSADQITAPAFSDGYLLSGWLFEDIYGTSQSSDKVPFYSDYTVASAMNFKAQYQKACTLTFQYRTDEMAEGEYVVAAKYYVKQQSGTIYDAIDENGNSTGGSLPTVSIKGYQFNGWLKSDGSSYSPSYNETFAADVTYTADLTKTHYIVTLQTLNFTTGVYETTNTLYVPVGSALSAAVDAEDNAFDLENVTGDDSHIFTAWTKLDGTNVDANTVLTEDTVLQAQYLSNDVKVTFVDAENGTNLVVNLKRGDMLGDKLPANPVEPANKLFVAWVGANNMPATAITVINEDTTFTAMYNDAVNVTFAGDMQDGTAVTVKLVSGSKLGECIPTMENAGFYTHFFLGWFDENKVKATPETVVNADTVFTAEIEAFYYVTYAYEQGEDIEVDGPNGEDSEDNEISTNEVYIDLAVKAGDPLSEAINEAGEKVGIPTDLNDDIAFIGWFNDADEQALPETIIEGNAYYTPKYETVDVTFNYNSNTYTYTVIVGTEFAEVVKDAMADAANPLPNLYDEDPRFIGWGFVRNGEVVIIPDDQLITAEYLATLEGGISSLFTELKNYTITLHDVQPDKTAGTTTVTVPAGKTFASVIDGAKMADGRSAADVINWYTLDENGNRNKYDPATALSSNLDLYTYTYQIVLSLPDVSAATFSTASSAAEKSADVDPSLTAGDLKRTASILDFLMPKAYAAEVDVSDDGTTLTIKFQDGEKLSYADFVKDGIDYTMYNWTFTSVPEGSGINSIDTLINYVNNSMQPDDVITASGQAPNYTTKELTIDFKAYIDDEWKSIGAPRKMSAYIVNDSVVLSANQLEAVYRDLGFKASDLTFKWGQTNWTAFGYIDTFNYMGYAYTYLCSGNLIQPVGTTNFVRVQYDSNYEGASIIYYFPGTKISSQIESVDYLPNYKVDSNRFHSITVKGESDPIAYIRREGGTVTLEPRNGQVWKLAEGYKDSCTLAADGLTITNATGPIVVEPAGDVFYTVKAISPDGLLGVMPSPLEQEVKSGENSKPVFLPTAPEGYKWNIPANATYEVADVENGQTYTFTNVRSNIVVELMKRQVFNVTISDPDSIFADVVLPTVDPVYEGDSFTVTLPIPTDADENGAEYNWFVDGVCEVNYANNGDGTLTYTVSNVMSDVTIEVSSGEIYTLIYHVNAPTASDGTIDEVPTIAGKAEYSITVQYNGDGTATYTLLSPSLTEVIRTIQIDTQYYKKSHFFDGWMSAQNGTEAQFKAEEAALLSNIVALDTDDNKTIHLYGRWIDGELTQSLSYYIHLGGAVMTYNTNGQQASNNFVIKDNQGWTDGIYGTYVTIDPIPDAPQENWPYDDDGIADVYSYGGVVIYDQTSTGKSNVDSEHTTDYVVRNLLKSAEGVNAKYYGGVERNFSIGYVPSDDAVLRKLREMQAEYIQKYNNSGYDSPNEYISANANNQKLLVYEDIDECIPVSDLTPDNFYIKWYAFKYGYGNAWHIDGALIRKHAELIVQKTFYGDAEMISAVKNRTGDSKYYVSVTRNDRDATGTNYTLYLEDAEVNGNTYTWKLAYVTGNRSYTVTEHNYFYDTEVKTTSAEYRVVNPTTGTSTIVSPGWHAYTDGVTVTTRAYGDNETAYQTVQLTNRYVPTDELLIRKVDTQGEFLSGVSFQVKKGDSVVNFYPKDGKYHMESIEGINPVTTLTTDADGSIWIVLPETATDIWNGTYTLIETHTPDEYNKIQNVTFVVKDGKITSVTPVDTASVTNGNIMTVLNRSKTTNVAVQKNWTNAGDAKPVTLTLYKNGAAMAGKTVTLDGVVDGQETDEWYHCWEGLDLFAGGERIVYTVREDSIGSGDGIVNYDPKADATDGYADYVVSQNTKYYIYNNDENKYVETTDYVNATDVIVAVSNTLDKGNVTFLKTDGENPLAGAQFTIYSNAACTNVVATALSDATGMVTFTDLNPGVYYVMKETGVPEGYVENTTIYTVQVSGNGFKIIDGKGNEIDTIVNTPIPDVELTVKKVDNKGNALDGSEFQIKCGANAYLYEGGSTSKIVPLIANSTNGDAIHTIKVETSNDTYTISETTAPAGFYGLNGTISFKVTNGKVTDETCPEGVDFNPDTNTFTVTNTPGTELPSTGGAGTTLYTIGGLLLMAASLLYGIGLRRKRERGEAI